MRRYRAGMRATGTFEVAGFAPAPVTPEPMIQTALAVGVATMRKQYTGEVTGRSATLFTSAYDQASGVGTYLAMEPFEGSVGGRAGAFNFIHSAATTGADRRDEFFRIVVSSGIGQLAGIRGGGGMAIDADGVHRIWLDYELD